MAPRYCRSARIGGIHVRISRRPHNAGNRVAAFVAREQADFSRTVRADAEDSSYTSFLPRRVSNFATLGWARLATRVARRAAFYLPRRAGTSACKDASETGLSV